MDLDEFQRRIVASRLVDEDDAAFVRAELSDTTILAFAESLIEKRLITPWQCGRLLDGRSKGFFIDHFKLLEYVGQSDDRMRYLAENTATRKHVILSIVRPKTDQPMVYDVEKLPPQSLG